MSVEEIYDQVVEEKVIDEMYADQDEVDEEEEFTKQPERKWQLEPIAPELIDRRKLWGEVENYLGHPCPVLLSSGSLPMIAIRDENFKLQEDIVMTSCIEVYDPNIQKIYEWLLQYGDEIVINKAQKVTEEEEYEIPRAVQGLARLVDDARENLQEIWNPTMFTKKKKMRLLREKKNQFIRIGADQVAVAIVQHIQSLVKLGHFPERMFGEYLKHSSEVKNAQGEAKIVPLLDLILCAEVIMPSQEELIPKKRIDTALPSAGGV